jgi:glycosyltransferase involved in cell wall biosynthesis
VRVDQVLPNFVAHDAIGNHTLQLRRSLRAAGIESDIYAEVIDGRLAGEARPWTECPTARRDDRVLLYHASTDSPMADWLVALSARGQRVLCDYHNITPAAYFTRWEPDAARSMERGRAELAQLAPHVELAVADSRFNEAELTAVGYRSTATCHLLVDLEEYHRPPDARTVERLRRARDRGRSHWLFVGRIAPNKCQHDVIGAFALYRKAFDPAARLTLVGGVTSARYLRALHQLAGDLELGSSLEVVSGIGFTELLAYYASADVFVCLSEHEGFCVPVLEAMELGLPVVAYAAAALPETVGTAATLLADKDPLEVACAVHGLLADDGRRLGQVKAGRERAAAFSLPRTSEHFVRTLSGAMAVG